MYKNKDSARNFVHYIAESQRQELHGSLSSRLFYSILMDGSVDKGRVEDELMVILFCQRDDTSQEVKTCARYLCVVEPKRSDADGLLECLSRALTSMGLNTSSTERMLLVFRDTLFLLAAVQMVHLLTCLIKMESEESFKVLYLGYSGHGAMLIGWKLHAKMLCPASSSMILMTCS